MQDSQQLKVQRFIVQIDVIFECFFRIVTVMMCKYMTEMPTIWRDFTRNNHMAAIKFVREFT